MRSLDAYSRILDASSAEAVLLQLMVRHDCTIFAPFDGLSMGDQFPTLLAALPPARQAAFLQLLGDPRFVREQLSRITNTFWTWQPLNFADVDGSVICTPMLGLWNEYPTSHILAPPSPRELAPHLHNTADEIVHLLDNVYWQILETLFNAVRLACGLGVAEPEFYDIESRPPCLLLRRTDITSSFARGLRGLVENGDPPPRRIMLAFQRSARGSDGLGCT